MKDHNPFSPPSSEPIFFEEELFLTLAGRGQRLAAKVLDFMIFLGLAVFLAFTMTIFLGTTSETSAPDTTAIMVILVAFTAFFGINMYFLYINGQTLGKKMLGIRIVRTDGEAASIWRLLGLRALAPMIIGFIPLVGFIFGICDPLCIFRENQKCLHDDLADTIVVDA